MKKASKQTTKTKTAKLQPVIVCTDKRGVFFGYVPSAAKVPLGESAETTLANARMAVYWDASIKGVLGLGSAGPGPKCRVGQPVPSLRLRGIHAVIEPTAIAVSAWESAPWM